MHGPDKERARRASIRAAMQISGAGLALLRIQLRQALMSIPARKRLILGDALCDLENDYTSLCRSEFDAACRRADVDWQHRLTDWETFHGRLCEMRIALGASAWNA